MLAWVIGMIRVALLWLTWIIVGYRVIGCSRVVMVRIAAVFGRMVVMVVALLFTPRVTRQPTFLQCVSCVTWDHTRPIGTGTVSSSPLLIEVRFLLLSYGWGCARGVHRWMWSNDMLMGMMCMLGLDALFLVLQAVIVMVWTCMVLMIYLLTASSKHQLLAIGTAFFSRCLVLLIQHCLLPFSTIFVIIVWIRCYWSLTVVRIRIRCSTIRICPYNLMITFLIMLLIWISLLNFLPGLLLVLQLWLLCSLCLLRWFSLLFATESAMPHDHISVEIGIVERLKVCKLEYCV